MKRMITHILIFLTMFATALVMFHAGTSVPTVYVTNIERFCVRVDSADENDSCSNLPTKYLIRYVGSNHNPKP